MDPDQPNWRRIRTDSLALWTTCGGLVVSLVLAFLSPGTYHDDGLTHYLLARWSWHYPPHLLDEWGRPGLTGLLFPAARFGLIGCKVLMACVTAATIWLTYRAAAVLRLQRASWIPLLCYVQPLLLVMSYGTMTETAMAFYLAVALWLHVTDRPEWGACALSLCFITRYESVVLGAVWVVALWQARASWAAYACLLWAPILHNGLGLIYLDRLPLTYFGSTPQLLAYGAGTPLTMLTRSMAAFGPAVATVAIVGCLRPWRSRRGWLVPACLAAFVLTHTIVYWLGTHGSGGYPRFLVSVSPLAALAAANGLERLTYGYLPGRRAAVVVLAGALGLLWLGAELESAPGGEAWIYLLATVRPLIRAVAVCVLLLTVWWLLGSRRRAGEDGTSTAQWVLGFLAVAGSLVPLAVFVRPHALSVDARDIQAAVAWIREQDLADRTVIATNVWASHFLDRASGVVPPDSTDILDGAAAGTVFIWDAEYSPGERFGLTRERITGLSGDWRCLWSSPARGGDAFARIYEKGL